MRFVTRFGLAVVLCLGLSLGLHAAAQIGAHASAPVAGPAANSLPSGAFRLYRTGADMRVLTPLGLRSLADLVGPMIYTDLVPVANQFPDIVATAGGSKFATMQNIWPNNRVVRAQALTLQVFDARTGAPVTARLHPAVPVWISGISADGSVVYGQGADTNWTTPCASTPFYLLSTRTGQVLQRFTLDARPWDPVAVGPNLQRLYTMTTSDHINSCGPKWSYSPAITAYDLQTGKTVRTVRLKGVLAGRWETSRTINGEPIGRDWSPGFALSPDGSQIAVLDGNGDTLTLLNAKTLQIVARETLSRPSTGFQTVAALLGLRPDVAEAKGQWYGAMLGMQYTPDGRSLLVTGSRLRPDKHHLYASSRFLGIRLIDVATGQIKAWLNENKQIIGVWPAPDGSAVYSAIQTQSRSRDWKVTLRRHDSSTLQIRQRRVFSQVGNWFLNLYFLRAR